MENAVNAPIYWLCTAVLRPHSHHCVYPGENLGGFRVFAWGKAAGMAQAVVWGYTTNLQSPDCQSIQCDGFYSGTSWSSDRLMQMQAMGHSLNYQKQWLTWCKIPWLCLQHRFSCHTEDVKWQGNGSLPGAATAVAETIIFRGFL